MVFSRVPGFVNQGRCTLAAKTNSARPDPAHPMRKKDVQEKRNRQADTRRQRPDHPPRRTSIMHYEIQRRNHAADDQNTSVDYAFSYELSRCKGSGKTRRTTGLCSLREFFALTRSSCDFCDFHKRQRT
jgi:hypothetical protein